MPSLSYCGPWWTIPLSLFFFSNQIEHELIGKLMENIFPIDLPFPKLGKKRRKKARGGIEPVIHEQCAMGSLQGHFCDRRDCSECFRESVKSKVVPKSARFFELNHFMECLLKNLSFSRKSTRLFQSSS